MILTVTILQFSEPPDTVSFLAHSGNTLILIDQEIKAPKGLTPR